MMSSAKYTFLENTQKNVIIERNYQFYRVCVKWNDYQMIIKRVLPIIFLLSWVIDIELK